MIGKCLSERAGRGRWGNLGVDMDSMLLVSSSYKHREVSSACKLTQSRQLL